MFVISWFMLLLSTSLTFDVGDACPCLSAASKEDILKCLGSMKDETSKPPDPNKDEPKNLKILGDMKDKPTKPPISNKDEPKSLQIDAVDALQTKEYKVERRQYKVDGQCIEEINILWNDSNRPLQFKPKCLQDGSFRTAYHADNQVLIIGSPSDEFFIFSKVKRQYFYKENNNWKRGDLELDEINESPITSSEDIDRIKGSYDKYLKALKIYNENITMLTEEKKEEERRHNEELKRINALNEGVYKDLDDATLMKINMELEGENDYYEGEDKRITQLINKEKYNLMKRLKELEADD